MVSGEETTDRSLRLLPVAHRMQRRIQRLMLLMMDLTMVLLVMNIMMMVLVVVLFITVMWSDLVVKSECKVCEIVFGIVDV